MKNPESAPGTVETSEPEDKIVQRADDDDTPGHDDAVFPIEQFYDE